MGRLSLVCCCSTPLLVLREMLLSVLLLCQPGGSWLSPRLPKWLFEPLRVTNFPLVAAPDLGLPCFVGGEEGVCSPRADCGGARTVAGPCTLFKSVCCLEKISCNNNISQAVASFTNPVHPAREVGRPAGDLSVLSVLMILLAGQTPGHLHRHSKHHSRHLSAQVTDLTQNETFLAILFSPG